MLTSILLLLTTLPVCEFPQGLESICAVATNAPAPKAEDDYAKRKKEAGKDIGKLWKLYEWCKGQKKEKEAKSTLKEIVKIDPLHKEANIALGNIFFDGKWFENQAKIEEYKKQKDIDEKHAQGLVEYKGEWVPKEDVPFLEKGLVKDDIGNWVNGDDAKKLKEGYVKQDLAWIPPAEKENIEKGLWKCGDAWLSLADADKYHAELYQEWRIPYERYVVWTTCERDFVNAKMKRQLDPAMEDLDRIFGSKPELPINVFVLKNLEQYNLFAAGDEEAQIMPAEIDPMSSVYRAFFGDLIFDDNDQPNFMGVSYWDASNEKDDKFGVHNVRHAIGLSYAEALDPSPEAAALFQKSKAVTKEYVKKFRSEKRLPTWFRYGAAAYVERYYLDKTVGIGGNPKWTREWSVQNILKSGGLRPLKQVFECKLKPGDPEDTSKLINETGLIMSFVVDGNCAPVMEKHKAFLGALKTAKDRKPVDEAARALETEITKHETDLRKFAGL